VRLWIAAAVAATVAVEASWGPPWPEVAGDLAAGAALLIAGVVAAWRRASRIAGALLLAAGVAWLVGTTDGSLAALHRGPLVHALLLGQDARLRSPLAIATTLAAYVTGALADLAVVEVLTLGVAALLVISLRPAALALAGGLALGALASLTNAGLEDLGVWAYYVAVAATAALAAPPRRPDVTGLVADLGELGTREALRERLARAIGDPELQIGFPPDPPPEPAGNQVRTEVTQDGELIAVLVHDRSALEDAGLRTAVEAVVRLAVANVRRQAEILARAEEVAASRRRLVVAADAQRQALEGELRASAGQRLEAVARRLTPVDGLEAIRDELERARDDLERFARGLHPAALQRGGLPAALAELVAGSPLPVELAVAPRRFPQPVEATAYFVAAEAIANAVKHAEASRVLVSVDGDGARLTVRIADDGRGGASGLVGLRDRVEALGGRLEVASPIGDGTTLSAELPVR
jgi:signal transduction histidine kinase